MYQKITINGEEIPTRVSRNLKENTRNLVKSNPSFVFGAVLVLGLIILAIIGPSIAPYDPIKHNYSRTLESPSPEYPFGTDKFGRDQLSRVLHGARIDLMIGIICVSISLFIGLILGSIAGYYGGLIDTILMRIVDVQIAFPYYIMVIAILAILGRGLLNMYIALILVEWVTYTRLIRAEVLVAKEMEYILAAKALGYSDFRIMLKHILPNVIGPAIIFSVSDVTLAILAGASLGFLGLGVQAPAPEWGVIIADAREYLLQAWWLPVFPGLAITITGISFSLLGDGLSVLLRPRNS